MDDATIILIITISTTFLGVVLRYAFQSKCDRVSILWGCCKIHREVEVENNIPADIETTPPEIKL